MNEENPFRQALELFEGGEGWCQGASYRSILKDTGTQTIFFEESLLLDNNQYQEQFCATGALARQRNNLLFERQAVDALKIARDAMRMLKEVLKEQYPSKNFSSVFQVQQWNDQPTRTFEEVERVFQKAEIRWDEEYG